MSNSPAPSVFDLLPNTSDDLKGEELNKLRQQIFKAQESEEPKELKVNVREMSLMLEFFKGRNSDLSTELALSEAKYALMVHYVKGLEDHLRFMQAQLTNDFSKIEEAALKTNERDRALDSSVNPDLNRAIKENATT